MMRETPPPLRGGGGRGVEPQAPFPAAPPPSQPSPLKGEGAAAPAIILVRPQMGENIGAAARAMWNFGLSDLRLVSPRDGWPNQKANDMAAHAEPIIEHARIFPDVASAMADLHFVAACTARPRDLTFPVLTPAESAREMRAQAPAGGVGLLFGSERTGLENEELVLANAIVTIPTAPAPVAPAIHRPTTANASLNLAQAVVVLAYAWSAEAETPAAAPARELAPKSEIENLLAQLEKRLNAVNFWRVPEKKERMWLNLRRMILRMEPTSQEVLTLHGVMRALGEQE